MKVIVKYTTEAEPAKYEIEGGELRAKYFAKEECKYEDTQWAEIPEIGFREIGDYSWAQ